MTNENIYAAPQSSLKNDKEPTFVGQLVKPYGSLPKIVKRMLMAYIVLLIIGIPFTFLAVYFESWVSSNDNFLEDLLDLGMAKIAGIITGFILYAILTFTFYIILIVFYCKWVHRATTNAHGFSSDMTITPNWAVGWNFIPIAALVMPYKAMSEVWNASTNKGESRAVLHWWWGLFIGFIALMILSLVIDSIWPYQLSGLVTTIDVIITLVQIAQSIFAIKLITKITGFQETRATA